MAIPTPDPGTRLHGIDGLRAVAAVAVVVFHTWLYAGPGGPVAQGTVLSAPLQNLSLGVTLFFTLSGFLLYRPWAAAMVRGTPGPSAARYLRKRAVRVLPAYWAVLAVTALLLGTANVRDADGGLAIGALTDPLELLGAALLVNNLRPSTVLVGIGPVWSLAVEVAFYLVLPVLAAGAAVLARRARTREGRRLAALAPAALLLAVGLCGKLVAAVVVPGAEGHGWAADWHSVIERSFWAQADLFAFGMAVAVARVDAEDGRLRVGSRGQAGLAVGAAVLLASCVAGLGTAQLSYRPENTGVAVAFALLLAALVLPRRAGLPGWAAWLDSRAVVAVGAASYSLFLLNEPVIQWLARAGLTAPGWTGLAGNLALALPVCLVLAAAAYRWIERPVLRWDSRLQRRRTSTVAEAVAPEASTARAVTVCAPLASLRGTRQLAE